MSTYWNNNYSQKDSWYESDCYQDEECKRCEEKEQTLDYAKEFLEYLVTALYSKQPLNLDKFEESLDELCHALHVKMGSGDLQIQRLKEEKIIKTSLPMEKWIVLNSKYFTQITHSL